LGKKATRMAVFARGGYLPERKTCEALSPRRRLYKGEWSYTKCASWVGNDVRKNTHPYMIQGWEGKEGVMRGGVGYFRKRTKVASPSGVGLYFKKNRSGTGKKRVAKNFVFNRRTATRVLD